MNITITNHNNIIYLMLLIDYTYIHSFKNIVLIQCSCAVNLLIIVVNPMHIYRMGRVALTMVDCIVKNGKFTMLKWNYITAVNDKS